MDGVKKGKRQISTSTFSIKKFSIL